MSFAKSTGPSRFTSATAIGAPLSSPGNATPEITSGITRNPLTNPDNIIARLLITV
jgi:hypothetical protein